MRNKLILVFPILAILTSCTEPEVVDLIVRNGHIQSVDEQMRTFEAMAVRNGRIVEIGAENQIMNKYASDQVVDAKKQFVIPGFIDAHCHFVGYGIEKSRINLMGTKSFKEVVEKITMYIDSTESDWILGRGWDQNDWSDNTYPTNDTLNKLFPDKFIAIKRIDGHAYLASSNVLALANLGANSKINGGQVLSLNGKATGIVIDEAMQRITDIIPSPGEQFLVNSIMTAQKDCFKEGLTTVSDAGLSPSVIEAIDSMHQADALKMRIYAMVSASNEILNSLGELEIHSDRLDVNSVKIYADGALGSRGAYLNEPYADDTLHQGLIITGSDSLKKWAKACYDQGFQMNVHCIGDGANRMVLDAMGSVLKGTNDKRWRAEHAQVVSQEDIMKFGKFNIIPSVQPTHATSDMPWAEERLGKERMADAYAYKSLLHQNGLIALGTDFPVESVSPLKTFYAAVARKDPNGNPNTGFQKNEALTREQTLKGMTIWAAIANFEDSTRGSLEAGKFADFVILDNDLLQCDEDQILQTQILSTWINGEMVYEMR